MEESNAIFCQLSKLALQESNKKLTDACDIVFTARRHASAVYAVVAFLSVCLTQVGVLLKRLNAESRKQRSAIAAGLGFSDA